MKTMNKIILLELYVFEVVSHVYVVGKIVNTSAHTIFPNVPIVITSILEYSRDLSVG